jgi:hypothetical protein
MFHPICLLDTLVKINILKVRFQVLAGGEYEDGLFWGVPLCNLAETGRRFRGANCFDHQSSEITLMKAVSTSETSANFCKTTWCNVTEDDHLLS